MQLYCNTSSGSSQGCYGCTHSPTAFAVYAENLLGTATLHWRPAAEVLQALLAKRAFEILCEEAEIVVADEGHQIKNPTTKRFAAVNSLRTRRRIALTGYPLQNNLDEYYTMIRWCGDDVLGDVSYFHDTFAKPIQDGEMLQCCSVLLGPHLEPLAPTLMFSLSSETLNPLGDTIPPPTRGHPLSLVPGQMLCSSLLQSTCTMWLLSD